MSIDHIGGVGKGGGRGELERDFVLGDVVGGGVERGDHVGDFSAARGCVDVKDGRLACAKGARGKKKEKNQVFHLYRS